VPATIVTTPTSSIGCSVLRAEHQALAQQQAQFDKAEKSRAGREAADRAFAARQQAIEQAMRQLCG
jgi:phage-related minor tail protein